MNFVDIDEELNRLRITDDWEKSAVILELLTAFPDLKLFRDHYGTLKFCSGEVNSDVDMIEIDSCHTCDGKPIKFSAYSFIDKKGTRVYCDPPVMVIADQNPRGFGEIPRPGWEEVLQDASISRSVILKVRDHLSRHPPISYFED